MKIWTAFAVLLFAAALIACSPQTPGKQTASSTGDTNVATGNTTAAATGNIVEINMTAENFAFSPGVIKVRQGDRVIIRIVGSDEDHGLAIQGYDQQVRFGEGGDGATLDFVADKAGTFTFYCNVPCGPGHREMTGTLIVEA